MSGKLKIKEIAAQTGVSISTVSRVLAGKANTSAEVKQKVLDCAKSHGVLSDMSAGRLLFNHVTVFAPARAFDVRTDIFYYKVVQGIRSAIAQQEVRISYCAIEENDCDIPLFLKKINDPSCETAIIIGIDDPRVHELAADIGKPCVLINCIDRSMRLDVVSPNHQLVGEFSANYLIEHGHRDILTLMCLRRSTMERRLDGIKDAFANHNMKFDDSRHLVTTSGFGAAEAREAIATFLAGQSRDQYPTAILAGGDFMAVGAYEALQSLGLSVPSDISIMSMDGFNLAEIHDVPLTAVHVPRDELGEEALRLLQLRMTRPDAPFRTLLLSGKVAARSSVKRIGSKKIKAAVSTKNHGLYGN
ncbi:MAG: LacI family DNA-binding transcriptional regulator [Formivibrio sp.]|nr:LacI family DNA-binding transcriptional regulator [Formivibrio sp.]